MTDVLTPAGVREALAKHGLRPRKALGQNFLVSARAARMMIESLEPGADDFILEIGPGLGALTAGLAAAAGAVAAVEIDQSLIPVLSETVSGYNNVKIIRGDALRLDITELLGSRPAYKAAGSLPYYITGPILERLLNGAARPSLAVFLVQKEAAERFAARPGDPGYGVMSLLVQMNAGIEIAAHITPDAFYPQPGVDSVIMRLDMSKAPVITSDKGKLLRVIKAAFGTRRKTLVNSLSAGLGIGRERAAAAVEKCGFPIDIRGEKLGLEGFDTLTAEVLGNLPTEINFRN